MGDSEPVRRRLLAAVTVTGAALWLTTTDATASVTNTADQIFVLPDRSVSALGSRNDVTARQISKPLSLRVEELRQKLRSASPLLDKGSADGKVQIIVQFFNFMNCQRGPDGRCKR